jgi:hypothetical protein
MDWTDEATEIVGELLRELPATMRDSVLEKAETRAESLCREDGADEVEMQTAVRAVIESTPQRMRTKLRGTLEYHGIDPEDFEEAWDS